MSVQLVEAVPRQVAATPDVISERERMNEFGRVLDGVETGVVVETSVHLDTETPVDDAANYFIHTERLAGPNLYLHESQAALAEAGKPSFLPRRSRGRTSAHGVFFGDMLFEDGTVVQVAVKPHDDESLQSCATDYFTNTAAQELGLKTLEPLGMVVGAEGKAYSLTVRDETLRTLDAINWQQLAAQDLEQFHNVWGQVARQMAMLHSMGKVSHGDLAARNIAVGIDGGVFMIDWEHGTMSTQQPRDPEIRYSYSRADVGELMESLVRTRKDSFKGGIELLTNEPEPWQAFRGLIFDEYVATRLDFAKNPAERRDIQDELVELERSLQQHMGNLLAKYAAHQ